jgi:uncharacterized protein YaiI (UPF0178 family)
VHEIFVDADACPVKQEVYRVAERYGLTVHIVANARMYVPEAASIRLVTVGDGFDAADDWIVENAGTTDIVVTDDILLASRCVAKGVRAISCKGSVFSEAGIGGAVANREFLSQLREHGLASGGPAPFQPKDRSRFLQALDNAVQAIRRETL